ncbi:hypothetical protein CSKR_202823 [Clonorchis sinensis]|uniref:Uncharacterized protein n=1 Tax=Clonorchis sinensis TaxID=79923 RepID=A0A8T1M337_CLOSI|nr:hypothetical protein CSKR_202823 [Clonorchis sinensis]
MLLGDDFSIKYRSTDAIGQADGVSRLMDFRRQQREDAAVTSITVDPQIIAMLATTICALPITYVMVRDVTARDLLHQKVIRFHRTMGAVPKFPSTVCST